MKVNHTEDLLGCLKSKVNEAAISDLEIIVGKEKKVFYANSFLLALRSEVFEKMFFRSGMKEQQTKQWELPDVGAGSFLYFLEYLYTGQVELTGENVFDLLQLSEKYFFAKLNGVCQDFLKRDVTSENAIMMLDAALRLEAKDVIQQCWKIIDQSTKAAIDSPNSTYVSSTTIELLLSRDTLTIKEIDLFHFLVRWSKQKEKNDWQQIAKPFLQHIRLPLMSFKELIREVRPAGIVSDAQYIEALEFNGDAESFKSDQKTHFKQRKGPLDKFLPGPNYSLSSNSKIITKTGRNNNWNTTAITNPVPKGIHRWSLRIVNTEISDIMIGISPHAIDQTETNNHIKSGWYFYAYNSTLFSGAPMNFSNKSYTNTGKLGNGTILDVELNMSEGSVRYFINGKDSAIAYKGIPTDQPLRLAVLFYNTNDSVELISHSSQNYP